jgi:hypothetical protein
MTVTQARDPVPLVQCVTHLLEYSDAMDLQLRLRLDAYRKGWAAAEAAHADDYDRGYAQCAADTKAAQHAVYNHLKSAAELQRQRWGRRGREHFGDPRPGDYPGGAA